jgi:hypothetical protein
MTYEIILERTSEMEFSHRPREPLKTDSWINMALTASIQSLTDLSSGGRQYTTQASTRAITCLWSPTRISAQADRT